MVYENDRSHRWNELGKPQTYYSVINRSVNRELGGFHSAKIVMVSVDFAEIEQCQADTDWNGAAAILRDAANQLVMAGAECVVICTNTMHIVFDQVCDGLSIPCLHIADALGEFASRNDYLCLGLLGTRFTMEKSFLSDRLHSHFGIDMIIPSECNGRPFIGLFMKSSVMVKSTIAHVLYFWMLSTTSLIKEQGVILGCTEIGLLIDQKHTQLPVLDTTVLHAHSLVDFALHT